MRERARLVACAVAVACVVVLAGCERVPTQVPPAAAPAQVQPQAAAPVAPPLVPAPPAVPSGTVVAYYGTDVPAGWVVCDGRTTASGRRTPDLRNRFVLGFDPASGALLGESGGSTTHRHEAMTGPPREKDQKVDKGDEAHAANDGHTHDVRVAPSNHLPPYVRLVYIMKE